VYEPSAYAGQSATPIVFVLHGGGGSALVTQNFTRMNPVAEANEDTQASEELWRFFEGFTNGCAPTTALGLAAISDLTLQVFPNPFEDRLVVDFGRALPVGASVRSYRLDGQAVLQQRIQAGVTQHRLPLPADLPAGT